MTIAKIKLTWNVLKVKKRGKVLDQFGRHKDVDSRIRTIVVSMTRELVPAMTGMTCARSNGDATASQVEDVRHPPTWSGAPFEGFRRRYDRLTILGLLESTTQQASQPSEQPQSPYLT